MTSKPAIQHSPPLSPPQLRDAAVTKLPTRLASRSITTYKRENNDLAAETEWKYVA